jgi:transcriptional regulator with XRE-family HTH domain
MGSKRQTFSDRLRVCIDGCGLSRYRLCQLASLDQGTMSRFISDQHGLSLATINRLYDALDLSLEPRKKRRKAR